MTSGVFQSTPISSIIVNRDDRQRKSLEDIDSLAESLSRVGLIHPILIRREDLSLVAGERRLAAATRLGWTHINTQFEDDADELELQALELEENIQRVDIPWTDEVAAIEKYHRIKLQMDPNWSKEKTAEALGVHPITLQDKLSVAETVRANPKVAKLPNYSTAKNLVRRIETRKSGAQAELLKTLLDPAPATVDKPVIEADFNIWAPLYTGPRFNFIHCDFPYGIDANEMQQGSSVAEFGGYSDSVDVYESLLKTFVESLDRFAADEAHLIFWFSMKNYDITRQYLDQTDFVIDPFPLIWHKSDNKGLLPDPKRGGRRTYETAFFGVRGDRLVVNPVSLSTALPTGDRVHMSQKPLAVLQHFFRMVVDGSTSILDPTCGSGTALAVAKNLGAERVMGLEKNPEFVERANELIAKETKHGPR